jgi:uncharacterized protein YdeI (YjbR/CyaY-like superfamily)
MTPTFFRSSAEFRAWLEKNHSYETELLVGFYRKESGKAGITYPEALDEALCLGWIDGVRKRLDDASYTVRFTPRKPGSIWSAVNTRRVAELIKAGRMHAAGQKEFEQRDRRRTKLYSYERETAKLEGEYEPRFRANQKAWEFYQAQPQGYRRVSAFWVMSAKREETRMRRLQQLIESSAKGRRIDMLTPGRKK